MGWGVLGLGHIQVWKWRPQGLSIPMGEETEDRLPGELEPSLGGSQLVGQGLFPGGCNQRCHREEADFAERGWGGRWRRCAENIRQLEEHAAGDCARNAGARGATGAPRLCRFLKCSPALS